MRFQTIWQMPLLLGVASVSLVEAGDSAKTASPVAVASAQPSAEKAPAGPVDTAALLKQIEELKKQVAHIAYKQSKAEEKLETSTQVEDAKINILQANQVSPYPKGFISVPGTNSAVKVGGRVKIDGAYFPRSNADAGNITNNATVIPIKNSDQNGAKSGTFAATPANSRFEIKTISLTGAGDLTSWLEVDFQGSANTVTGPSNSPANSGYALRLRNLIAEWNGWTVGQTLTNFHDLNAQPVTLDNFGLVSGTTPARRVQVKYTQKICDGYSLSVAAEKSDTDYVLQTGATGNNQGLGKSNLPDLTARLRYETKDGSFVSLSGLVRQLAVNVQPSDANYPASATTSNSTNYGITAGTTFASKRTAYAFSSSFKYVTAGLSSLYGQVNISKGVNNLIAPESLPSAYLQLPASATPNAGTSTGGGNNGNHTEARFDLLTGFSGIFGYEHWWTEEFRTNIAGSYVRIGYSSFAPVFTGTTQLNSMLKKVLVNAIYSPIKQIDIGIEFQYDTRESLSGMSDTTPGTYYAGGTGRASQVTTSFIYRF